MKNPDKWIVYDSVDDFSRDLGMSDFDIAIVNEKTKAIKKLTKSRKDQGLTQVDLAERVGGLDGISDFIKTNKRPLLPPQFVKWIKEDLPQSRCRSAPGWLRGRGESTASLCRSAPRTSRR